MENCKQFIDYLNTVIKRATLGTGHDLGSTKYQLIKFDNTIILWIRYKYKTVVVKTIYSLLHSYMKHTDPNTELLIHYSCDLSASNTYYRDSNYNKYLICSSVIPSDLTAGKFPVGHIVARCDFWGYPCIIANLEDGSYPGYRDLEANSKHSDAMDKIDFSKTISGEIDCTVDNWNKYVDAMKSLYYIEVPDVTDQIITGRM